MEAKENNEFLTTQIITYIGNKRSLLARIENEIFEVKKEIGKQKLVCADLFSGSGIVARMMKKHSEKLIANDLEKYSCIINSCYLSDRKDYPKEQCDILRKQIEKICFRKSD